MPSATSIVTTAEIQTYLGQTGFDDLFDALGLQVTNAIEAYCGREFSEQSDIVEHLDGGGAYLFLKTYPVSTDESDDPVVVIVDTDSDDEVVDADDYEVNLDNGMINRADDTDWGSGNRRWQVTYDAGYTSVPNDVKLAALTWIGEIFVNRAGLVGEGLGDHNWYLRQEAAMPNRVKAMLAYYRRVTI